MSKPLSKDPDFPVIILSALRYAMGRNTYITSLTADFIKRHWHRIPYKHQYNIHRDLKEFIEEDTDTSTFNMIDHRVWQDLLNFIESQNNETQNQKKQNP